MDDPPKQEPLGDTALEALQRIQEQVLDAYRQEYRFGSDTFRDLDQKAQGTVAIAGVFLAAALAFIDKGTTTDQLAQALLVLSLLALVGCLVASIFALRVRALASPPNGDEVAKLAGDLGKEAREDRFAERLPAFLADGARLWKPAVSSLGEANQRKARLVWSAQRALVLAAVLVGTLILKTILS